MLLLILRVVAFRRYKHLPCRWHISWDIHSWKNLLVFAKAKLALIKPSYISGNVAGLTSNRGVRLEDGPGYTWVTPYFVPEITCFNWDRFVKGVGLCERGMWCKTGRWTSLYLGRTILCTRNHLFGGEYRPTPKGRKHWAGCQKTIERYSKDVGV